MELQEFISESLTQIITGISDAQKNIQKTGALINPKERRVDFSPKCETAYIKDGHVRSFIEFDVSITTSKTKNKEGKAGIMVSSIGAGGKLSSDIATGNTSRMKFALLVQFPQMEEK